MQPSSHNNIQANTAETQTRFIEDRLDLLSREIKRQKMVTMVLFVGAIVAVSATRVISQSQTNTLAVTTLQIVDNQGKVKAFLSADPQVNRTGATLALLDEKGQVRATISTDSKNSMISFSGPGRNAAPMAVMGYCDNSGLLTLSNQNSKNGATIMAGKEVAGVVVTGPSGKEAFSLEVDKAGGDLKVMDGQGRVKN